MAAEKAHDELSQANEQLRVDIEKWHEAKNKEVCQFMRQFATNHREYHQKVGDKMGEFQWGFELSVCNCVSGYLEFRRVCGGICKSMFGIGHFTSV